jgi:murein DD-endopeptidase MepM/ murein hydrolase activator NlpD
MLRAMKTSISNFKSVFLPALILLFMVVNTHSLRSNPTYVTPSEDYHIVARGETLFSISRKHSISVDQLKLFNNLDSDNIFVGQKIYLTPKVVARSEYVTVRSIPEEGYHLVLRGETVYRISKMYDLEIMEILEYNNLASFDIKTGQKIWLVPGKVETAEEYAEEYPGVAETVEPEEAPEEAPEPAAEFHIVKRGENLYRISLQYGMSVNQLKELNDLKSDDIEVGQRLAVIAGSAPAPSRPRITRPAQPSVKPLTKGSLHLPLNGTAISEFGLRNNMPHNGIDIAAPLGEPLHAAKEGKVVFVGTQRGYGNVVVLEHADYIMTVYAHNERNLVRLGDEVKKGQPIATVGQSGNAKGPHLHFEYRVRGKAINPREVLPDF